MDALTFLKVKFPLWEIQERGKFNTVSLREENLIEAMEEYAALKNEEEELQQCEGCDAKLPFEKIKRDSEGVPLCVSCFDALIQEQSKWQCKVCNRKSEEFEEDEYWADDNLCNTCHENE